jgi:hypothetical protein
MTPDEDSAAYMLAAARIARLERELAESIGLLREAAGYAPRLPTVHPMTCTGFPDIGNRIDAFLAARP